VRRHGLSGSAALTHHEHVNALQQDSDKKQCETKLRFIVAPRVPFNVIADIDVPHADHVAYALCVKPDKQGTEKLKNYWRDSKQHHHGDIQSH
jgi:hypothetical protein